MATMREIRQSNSSFFSRESVKFHGTRKYRLRGNVLTTININTSTAHYWFDGCKLIPILHLEDRFVVYLFDGVKSIERIVNLSTGTLEEIETCQHKSS